MSNVYYSILFYSRAYRIHVVICAVMFNLDEGLPPPVALGPQSWDLCEQQVHSFLQHRSSQGGVLYGMDSSFQTLYRAETCVFAVWPSLVYVSSSEIDKYLDGTYK